MERGGNEHQATIVRNERVCALLNVIGHHPLVIVRSPPGSGKTELARQIEKEGGPSWHVFYWHVSASVLLSDGPLASLRAGINSLPRDQRVLIIADEVCGVGLAGIDHD